MKAIITKYHGPTDTRGTRVRAKEPDGKSLFVYWDHSLDSEKNHVRAANALRDKLGWKGELITGWCKDFYVHVFKPQF